LRIGTGRDAADAAFATIYGAVRTHAPTVSISAVEDVAHGVRRPQRTPLAVSTAASTDPRPAPQTASREESLLPFLLHSSCDMPRRRESP
jgi:hypothetical protein